MMRKSFSATLIRFGLLILALFSGVMACARADRLILPVETQLNQSNDIATIATTDVGSILTSTPAPDSKSEQISPTVTTSSLNYTPTPDSTRIPPPFRSESVLYVVRLGDSLNYIAQQYQVGVEKIMLANGLTDPNLIAVGQSLTIPPPNAMPAGPAFKIIPDSELVYGPASVGFDLEAYATQWDSYLCGYTDEIEGKMVSGPQIVQLVAQRYSVNPRLLLAILEYQSGWVTRRTVSFDRLIYPIGYIEQEYGGLFSQLSWAADQLNLGYYRWRAGWAGPFVFADGNSIPIGRGLNAGTVGVQFLFSELYPASEWREVVAEGDFDQTYGAMFGNPFRRAIDPLIPDDFQQPIMQLPFESGKIWSFTGGPHSAWGDGAAWAALDFAPPGNAFGCIPSTEWVVALADGLILRAEQGEVMQDLDGDGSEQTGWAVLYMHIGYYDRVQPGTYLHAGDRIGHPSCEGGISTGTHVHLVRKYNGEWIPADGRVPFNLDGWVSAGADLPYDGTMTRDTVVLEAYSGREPGNQISR